ncbi:MAG: cryptochrome/photolyase family protein [Alphaproteobacteria bacterium CG_4_10_14_0_8_um_filter_37_21]|nr:MAG: cryptochrome/photolyase family protein [Alphaproteobacteria bacterium CG_4_10_14_0_8_um_filter_37_21]
MKTLRIIFEDNLSLSISSLEDVDKKEDFIFMSEATPTMLQVKHHKKKIAFLISAMRHFAEGLKKKGYNIIYDKISEHNMAIPYRDRVSKIIQDHNIGKIIVTEPSAYSLQQEIMGYGGVFNIPIEIKEDGRFLSTIKDFKAWTKNKKQLRMEFFYREMRTKHAILLDGGKPVTGTWNYDKENRKFPTNNVDIPKPYSAQNDTITLEAIKDTQHFFKNNFGDIIPFYFAVTREQALDCLALFITDRLKHFGDYQDAMIQGEPWMYHSHLSFYLNCGLLLPMECIKAAESAYHAHRAPLNAVEGFIRQILGWREYIRGIYWLKMPHYKESNFLNATRNLPGFYWDGITKMNCLHQCVDETRKNAYAHHIQRLMVLGNFALIAGIDPKYVNEWFLIVYADAFEWVELPNVTGMILFADGGFLGSKPYASGGNYINKMSNYCKNCHYSIRTKNGPKACPFNYLYWDFLSRNREKLEKNNRIGMMYKTYDRFKQEQKNMIQNDSQTFLNALK